MILFQGGESKRWGKESNEKEERTKKPDEAKSGKDLPPVYEIHIQSFLPCVVLFLLREKDEVALKHVLSGY